MKAFVLGTLLLATACSASYLVPSSQYQAHDGHGGYSYGYADPNSQKHETKDAHGITHGGYSYVDGNGIVQSVKYTADPVHGFQVAATNLPVGPAPAPHAVAAVAPVAHYAAPWAYHHAALPHHPLGGAIETPEVQAAKAAHFAAHAEARARLAHAVHKRSVWGYAPKYVEPAPLPVNGVPQDTAEVAHAKAAHLAAVGAAYHGAVHHSVPVDTPDVQHAKAAHFAAHAAVRHGAPAPVHHYPQHVPVIHNGVPVDTPEVQHAKAAHFAAHAKVGGHYAPAHAHAHYPYHVPVIHNGVPVDTPEVQHARAAHFSALAAAGHGGYHNYYDHLDGQWDGRL